MKYLVSLIVGLAVGVVLFATAIYHNPFAANQSVSPLAVGGQQLVNLSYNAVPSEGVLFTNDGESTVAPFPEDVAELWEDTVRNSNVRIVQLRNGRGEVVGLGYKFASASEDTRVLNSEALVDSAWHILIPGRGTLFVGQRENYWSYARDVVAQARWSSADNWRGAWSRVMTVGPNSLGTAVVVGGSGELVDAETEAVESMRATAYSTERGPLAMEGTLAIALPDSQTPRAARQD